MLRELPTHARAVKPSQHIRNHRLTWTEKLAETATANAGIPLAIFERTATVISSVPDVKPLFMAVPSVVHFQNYEPFKTYECAITFRNIDKLPRRLRVDLINEPRFEIVSWKSLSNAQKRPQISSNTVASHTKDKAQHAASAGEARVAAGIDVPFLLRFTPDESRDYHCNIVCHTERETFVVPIHAVGPRAVLDLPDEINFSSVPVRYKTTKTLLLRNIGSREAKFVTSVLMSGDNSDQGGNISKEGQITTNQRFYGLVNLKGEDDMSNPYSIDPVAGFVGIGKSTQLNVTCFPTEAQPYPAKLLVHYDTGELISVDIYAESEDVDVRLEKQQIHIKSTYLRQCSFETVRIWNRSDILASYSWKIFSSVQEEANYRRRKRQLLEMEEKDELDQNQLDDSDLKVRLYENKRHEIDKDPLLFEDSIFNVEPVEAKIWPNSYIDVTIQFQPDQPGLHTKSLFCEVSGRASRLPLQLKGEGVGPKVRFSYDLLDIDAVFVNSEHVYEVLLENMGDIGAPYAVIPKPTLYGPRFQFDPAQGELGPGERQIVRVQFSPVLLGDFHEDFLWSIQGALEPLKLTFRGQVIGPTFQFDVPELDFGCCSLSFRHRGSFGVINTSEIPMTFHLHIGRIVGLEETNETPIENEFEIYPVSGTIPPLGCQVVIVNFTPNVIRSYVTELSIDVDSVGIDVFRLPISGTCAIPKVYLAEQTIMLQDCYLGIPYERNVTLINPDPLTARYELFVTNSYACDMAVTFPLASGVIEPSTSLVVPLVVTVYTLGSREESVTLKVHGRTSQEPLKVVVQAIGIGPHLTSLPEALQWGTIPVLHNELQTITLHNDSPIGAAFACTIGNGIHSVFSVRPSEGLIPPQEYLELTILARLDDSVRFNDLLELVVKDGQTFHVTLSAKGQGTTITFDEALRDVNFHDVFTNQASVRHFTIANQGRRTQIASWVKTGNLYGAKPQDNVLAIMPLEITPLRFTLKPGHKEVIALKCFSSRAMTAQEVFICQCTIESDPTRRLVLESKVSARFINPLLQFQPHTLRFLYSHSSEAAMEVMAQDLSIRNTTDLPVSINLKVKPPFRLPGISMLQLDPQQMATVVMEVDPTCYDNRLSALDKGRLIVTYSNHPQRDQIELFADVRFPNVEFSINEIQFGTLACHEERRVTFEVRNISRMPVNYCWWVLLEEDQYKNTISSAHDDKTQNKINKEDIALLEIFPAVGTIKPGASIRTEALLVGTDRLQQYERKVVCDIDGGPKYAIDVRANISTSLYAFDTHLLDFGTRSYQEVATGELILTNQGNMTLPFAILPFERVEDSYRLYIAPGAGVLQPYGQQRFVVRMCACAPDTVDAHILIRVGNDKAEVITVRGEGISSYVHVDLPRESDPGYEAVQRDILSANKGNGDGSASIARSAEGGKSVVIANMQSTKEQDIERRLLLLKSYNVLRAIAKHCNVSPAYVGSTVINKLYARSRTAAAGSGSVMKLLDKDLSKLVMATYVCDFGSVVRGATVQRSFAITNIGKSPVSFQVLKAALEDTGFSVTPERIKGLPEYTSSAPEKVEMSVILSVGAQQSLHGVAKAKLQLVLFGGPTIEVHLKATVTTPDLTLSQTYIDFQNVICGTRMTIPLKITNSKNVPCNWSIEAPKVPQIDSRKKQRLFEEPQLELRSTFSVTPVSGNLQPSDEATLYFSFQPAEAKIYELVMVMSVSMNPQSHKITLQGQASCLQIDFAPSVVDFGTVIMLADVPLYKTTIINCSSENIEVCSVDFDQTYKEEERLLSLCDRYENDYLYLPLREPGGKWALENSRLLYGGVNGDSPNSLFNKPILEGSENALLNDDTTDYVGELVADNTFQRAGSAGATPSQSNITTNSTTLNSLPSVLVIHGPPLSGKTSVANAIVVNYPSSAIFRMDDVITQILLCTGDTGTAELAQAIHEAAPNVAAPSLNSGSSAGVTTTNLNNASVPATTIAITNSNSPTSMVTSGTDSNTVAAITTVETTHTGSNSSAHMHQNSHDAEGKSTNGDQNELLETTRQFTEWLVADIVRYFLTQAGNKVGLIVDGLDSRYCRSPVMLLRGIMQAAEGRKIIFLHLTLEASLIRQRERERKREEDQQNFKALPKVVAIDEDEYDSLGTPLRNQYDMSVKRFKDAHNELVRRQLQEKRRLEEDIALRVGEKKLEEERSKRKDKSKKAAPKAATVSVTTSVDKEKSMASLASRDFNKPSPKPGVSLDKISFLKKDRDKAEQEAAAAERTEQLNDLPPEMLLSEPAYRRFETYQATIDAVLQQIKEAEKQQSIKPAAVVATEKKKPLREGTFAASSALDAEQHVSEEPGMKLQELSGTLNQNQLTELVINSLPATDPVSIAPKYSPDEEYSLLEHAVRRPKARLPSLSPASASFLIMPYKEPKDTGDELTAAPVESLQTGALKDAKKQPRSVKMQEEIKPEIETLESPESEKYRWIIPAFGQQDIAVRFQPIKIGNYDAALTFEIVGCDSTFTLPCRGQCQHPRLESDPQKVFSKVRKCRTERDSILAGEYLIEESIFFFGPLLISHTKDKYVDRYMEHRAVLAISNSTGSEIKVTFLFATDTKGDCFLLEPSSMDIPPFQTQQLSIWAFPRFVGSVDERLVCCIKDNPAPLIWKLSCIGVKPDLEIEKKQIAFEKILLGKSDVKELHLRNNSLIPIAWKLQGIDSLSEEVHISPGDGIISPLATQDIIFRFIASKLCVVKRPIKLEYTDVERSSSQIAVETVWVTAEAYDIAMDVSFPKGSDGNLDFGVLRVSEESRHAVHIKNKGKYELGFRFQFDVPEAAQSFTVTPMQGIVQPGEKPYAVQIIFCASREVQFSDKTVLRCLAIDPASGEIMSTVPVRAIAKAVYSRFNIVPARNLNFGSIVLGTKSTRSFIVENTGEFDFRFSLYKIVEGAGEHRSLFAHGHAHSTFGAGAGANTANAMASTAVTGKGKGMAKDKASTKHTSPTHTSTQIGAAVASNGVGVNAQNAIEMGSSIGSTTGAIPTGATTTIATAVTGGGIGVNTGATSMTAGTVIPGSIAGNSLGSKAPAKKEMIRQADANNFGAFTVSPVGGSINAGSKCTISVEYHPENVGSGDELVGIDVSDRNPQDAEIIEYRFTGDACVPGINTTDLQSIFDEYSVCKRLELYGEQTMVFAEEERVFYFGAFITGQEIQARFKLSNPYKVSADLSLVVRLRSKTVRGETSDFAFEIQPPQLSVPSHDYRYVTVTFRPTSIQQYTGLFEATVNNVTSSTSRGLTFELRGEGTLPRVVVEKPATKNSKSGATILNFRRLLLGSNQTQSIAIRNDGIISAKFGLEWSFRDSECFKCNEVDETFMLKPQATQVIDVLFKPTEARMLEAELRLKVIDNPFEINAIQLLGEGFVDIITFENFSDDLDNELRFGPCLVGETVTKQFTVVNRAAEVIKVTIDEQRAVVVKPSCFHLRPGRSRVVTVMYSPAAPSPQTDINLKYKLSTIAYRGQPPKTDWDDRSTNLQWTPPSSTIALSGKIGTQSFAQTSATRKIYEAIPEPPFDPVGAPIKDHIVTASFSADYAQYECSISEIKFRDTMMYQTRVYRFQLHNTGSVRLEYSITLLDMTTNSFNGSLVSMMGHDEDGEGTENDSKYNRRQLQRCPFVVEPTSGVIREGEFATILVKFSPDNDQNYLYTLLGSFLRMRDSKDLSIPLQGTGLRPFCHFELPDSDYLAGEQRSLEAASNLKLEPGTRVIEFTSCGVHTKNLKRFFVINPTGISYAFEWTPRLHAIDVKEQVFQCHTPRGVIQSGKRLEVVFEFTPETIETVESLWTFTVPDHGIKVSFLLVGYALEPNVFIDCTNVIFRPVLVGKTVKKILQLINDEEMSFPFTFSQSQFETSKNGKPVLQFHPAAGTIGPKSKTTIEVSFQPFAERSFAFNLVCSVRRKQTPIAISIKGEGYQIHEILQAEMTDGSHLDLVPVSQGENTVDFGAVQINEHKIKRFLLCNKGKFNLDFTWKSVPAHTYVRILPDMGSVAKDEKRTLELSYLPMLAGALPNIKATCKITNGKTYVLSIFGAAVKPLVRFSRTKIDLGTQYMTSLANANAANAKFSVTNDDAKSISLDLMSSDSSLIEVDAGPFTVHPKDTVEIALRFCAREVGQYDETVTVNVNGTSKVDVVVSCVVVNFRVELLSSENRVISFGALRAGQQAVRTIKLVNRAGIAATFSLGPSTTIEHLRQHHCIKIVPVGPYTLKAKSVLSLQLTFEPTARLPAFSEELFIENASTVLLPLCLVNGACQGIYVRLENDTISFGAVVYQSSTVRKVQLQNTGDIGVKFAWNISQFGPDFSISPPEGYIPAGMDIPFEITFHPHQISPDIRYDNLICDIESHPSLSLTLSGICIPQPAQSEIIKFMTPVRHPETKNITLSNKTNVGWYIRPIVENSYWSGANNISVEAGSTAQYDVRFEPLEMNGHGEGGRHEGSVFFPLPDGSGLLYKLTGVAEKPLPAGTITRELAAKKSLVETLSVNNWLKRPQRFKVIIEQQKHDPAVTVKGHDYIDVPSLLTRDYKLAFFSYKEGVSYVKITFKNEQSQEYLFYNLVFKTTAPGVISTIDLVTTVRETCSREIVLSNPLSVPVTFSVTSSLPDISVPHTIVVGPRTDSVCAIDVLPLVPRESVGKLSITSNELGVFHHDMRLNALAAGYERTMHFKVGLGSVQVLSFRFANLCRVKTEYTCKIENPDFSVEKSLTVMPASGGEVSVDVTFEASKLGDVRTYLIISSAVGGDYTVPLHGYCTTPRPQGPIAIKPGTTVAVPFKNVFNQSATFSFAIDNLNFTIKAAETIAAKKVITINIGYKISSSGDKEKEPKERDIRDKDREKTLAARSANMMNSGASATASSSATTTTVMSNSKVSKLTITHPSGVSWVYYLKGAI